MTEKNSLSLERRLANPCIQICVQDRDNGVCIGCGRTSEEINNWLNISRADREKIVPLLDERIEQITAKRRKNRTGRANRARLRAERGLES